MWMPAAQSWGVRRGAELGWPLEGETWSPLTPRSSSDSMYSTASPEPRCPSGGCYRNLPQGGFIWVEEQNLLVLRHWHISKLIVFKLLSMYHSRLQQNLWVFNYTATHTAWGVCKYVSVCFSQCITSPGPPPQYQPLSVCPWGHPEWQMSVTRRQVN